MKMDEWRKLTSDLEEAVLNLDKPGDVDPHESGTHARTHTHVF